MSRHLTAAVAVLLIAVACSGENLAVPTTNSESIATIPNDDGESVLLEGEVELATANTFGDPGFHQVLELTGTVPEEVAEIGGELVATLVDIDRPDQECDRHHPLSGCATVDWSDFEDRPGVPSGGVFDNHLTVISTSGPVELFLSETGRLADVPDSYSPT
jgi:hypothetical protein